MLWLKLFVNPRYIRFDSAHLEKHKLLIISGVYFHFVDHFTNEETSPDAPSDFNETRSIDTT